MITNRQAYMVDKRGEKCPFREIFWFKSDSGEKWNPSTTLSSERKYLLQKFSLIELTIIIKTVNKFFFSPIWKVKYSQQIATLFRTQHNQYFERISHVHKNSNNFNLTKIFASATYYSLCCTLLDRWHDRILVIVLEITPL